MRETEEPRHQQLARNVSELLGELRVAQAGVQILFGFQLAVAFTGEFRDANGFEKGLYLVTVLFTTAATALLMAPAAWHRMLFRKGKRLAILNVGNRLVVAGLACLAAAITLTVSLIGKVIFGIAVMVVLAVIVGGTFSCVWFVTPKLMYRDRRESHGSSSDRD
ncbi:DUF6328 family protein [Saccharomonospora sp.]|uniref:DUF6328 family protein n=1 Tax=Saccharomonospora sp. TaxID=33913 RepID=UPI002617C1D8|nr:DUF6328 family protein [Saccharomonospora sp.]